jgi:hypothetical protein
VKSTMKTSTRFRIVGTEVVGMGSFLLPVLVLQLRESHFNLLIENFGWDYGIIGLTLILVGLEILSLVKSLPGKGSPSSKIGTSAIRED